VPNHRWLLASICALLCWFPEDVRAAIGARSKPSYSAHTWETDDGLPHNSVGAMVQTRDGYLWLGTLGGLARFDGIHFEVFDQDTLPGLNDSGIICLFEDSQRNLWIGTANAGTVIMKDGRVSAPTELTAGGGEHRLRAACEDSSGAVWLLHENGDLWRYANGRFTPFAPPSGAGAARAIIHETNGMIWVGTLHRQYAIGTFADTGSLELPLAKEPEKFTRLEALAASQSGGYWRCATGYVQRITNSVERDIAKYEWPREVSAACEDHDGNLVVGTKGAGVFFITPNGNVTGLSTNEGLSHPWVLSLLVDRAGTLWVGTLGGGLNRVKRHSFNVLEGTHAWKVQSVTEDTDGNMWIGSNRGLGVSSNGVLQQKDANEYLAVFADRDGRVWISTAMGELFRYQDGRFQGFSAESLIQHPVQAIHQDRAGRMWFGTAGGLVSLEKDKWRLFTARNGLSATNITSLANDSEGDLWIGTKRGGINRLRGDRFTSFRKTDGVPSDDISGLLVDEEGTLWVTTSAGLGRFSREKWTRYTTQQGLVSDKLSYLVEDGEGNLWLGSNAGVLRVPKKGLRNVADGVASSVFCRAYEERDGLLAQCTTGSQPGAWRARDGTLWFSTRRGAVALDPATLRLNKVPPPVAIESVSVNEARVDTETLRSLANQPLALRPGDERLEIQYASLNIGDPLRGRFRYWLEGYEKDWTEAGDGRPAVYRKLSPAKYTFHVTASNEDGVWNETGASFAIIVQPPFWRTWWFTGVTAVCLFGLVAGFVHYFSTQKLQRQLVVMRQQEALEKERARIARDIHDQVGASLTQVALLGELLETDKDSPNEVQSHAQQISQTARETTRALDEIVWTVNPQNDTLEGLVNYICKYAQDYLAIAGVRYRFDLPAQLPAQAIAPDVRHNVFLASKEAVTNIVRHANATAVWVRLRVEASSVILEIEDNGRGVAGLDASAAQTRNGLKNMRKRMEDIGGSFSIGPGREGGAMVRLTFPLRGEHKLAHPG
jgi:ligand-binding sensor domain-containing protein/signal transduction histidine kinase